MSPCCKYLRCDDIDRAVPVGVPVDIISPASSVITLLRLFTIFSMFRTSFEVEEHCLTSSFTLVISCKSFGSGISSRVTIHGPHGPKESKLLARLYCLSINCTSRAEMSFNTKYPPMYSNALL